MKNEKLRHKKLARNKKKRSHHNKVADHRSRCEHAAYKSNLITERENKFFEKMKKEMGL